MTTRRARVWVGLICSAPLWSMWVGVGVAQDTTREKTQDATTSQEDAVLHGEPALHAEATAEAGAPPQATLRPSRVNASAPLSGGERWVKRDGRWALQRINYRYLDAPDYAPRPAPPPTIDDFATLPNAAVGLRTRWFSGRRTRWGTILVSPFGLGYGNYGYLGYGGGYGWPGYGNYGGYGYGGWSGYGWGRRGGGLGWGVGRRRGSRFGFGLGWRLGGLFGF